MPRSSSRRDVLPKYLVRRSSGVYGLRFDIPRRLQSLIKKRKIVISLETRDLETALPLFRVELKRVEALVAAAEQALASAPQRLDQVQQLALVRRLTEIELQRLIESPPQQVWHPITDPELRRLAIEEGSDPDWSPGAEANSIDRGTELLRLQAAVVAANGQPEGSEQSKALVAQLEALAADAQQQSGQVFHQDDLSVVALAWAQAKATAADLYWTRTTSWQRHQHLQKAIEELPPPALLPITAPPAPPAAGPQLMAVVESWARLRRPAPRQKRKTEMLCELLIGITGHQQMERIGSEEARRFRDQRMATVKPQTCRGDLQKLGTLWRFAEAEQLLPAGADPFGPLKSTVTINPGDVLERRAFDAAEVATIAARCLELTSADVDRWAFPVLLQSGLRPEEYCCLRIEDLTTVDGVRVIRIAHEAQATGSLKTASSARVVPVPAGLDGFWEWGQGRRGYGAKRWLFDLRTTAKTPHRSNGVQNRLGSALRSWGLVDPATPVYSCRHSFAQRAVQSGMSDRSVKQLMGHLSAASDMTARYSGRNDVHGLKVAIDKIRWPEFDAAHS